MAKKFLLKNKRVIPDLQRKYGFDDKIRAEITESIEKTGELPKDLSAYFGGKLPEGLEDFIKQSTIGEKDYKGKIKSLKENTEFAQLSDEELEDQIELGRGLNAEVNQAGDPQAIKSAIEGRIANLLTTKGWDVTGLAGIIGGIADEALKNGGAVQNVAPGIDIGGQRIGRNLATDINSFLGILKNEYDSGSFYSGGLTKGENFDIAPLQLMLSERQKVAGEEAALDAGLISLKDEIGRGREEFIAGEEEEGARVFREELAPDIAQSLNVRGLLQSGDLPSELGRVGTGIASNMQNLRLQAQQEDELFFRDLGYKTALRRELEAGKDLSGAISEKRDTVERGKELSFQRTKADLRRSYDEEIAQRRSQRSIAQAEAKERARREREDTNSESEYYSGLIKTGAEIGTAAITKGLS